MGDPLHHLQEISVDRCLESLRTSTAGLASDEAARRASEFGANRVEEVGREPLALAFAREFIHFFAIILWIGAALALVADHFDPDQGMRRLAVAIVGVIVVNGLFSFWQQYKAERALAALRRLLPRCVNVVRDGGSVEVAVDELVPGDIVVLEEGDFVAADCRVIEAFALRVNSATVTGESLPNARDAQPCSAGSPLFASNIVLAGTSVVAGRGRAVVYATGMRTEFGRIAHLTQTVGSAQSPLQREIVRLSRLVALLASAIGAAMFGIGQLMGLPLWESLLFAIGIIVANVPEGLLPTVTLSLAMATQRMARRHALVRHLPAVEALGSTTVICSDKTGTLTQNRMSVERLWLAGLWQKYGEHVPAQLAYGGDRRLFENAGLCHNVVEVAGERGDGSEDGEGGEGDRRLRGDAMEIALLAMSRQAVGRLDGYALIDELPFSTERKRMSVLCATPHGALLYCKGALETVLPCCVAWQRGESVVELDDAARAGLLAAQDEMADAGLRVIAFAYRAGVETLPENEAGMVLSGLVSLSDPPRPEVPEAIARCAQAGIRVIMVTGDNRHTALAIARQIGLVRGDSVRVIGGAELHSMSSAQLQLALDAPELIFARVAAEQKMRIVEALQQKGEIVAVTGDGVNDAPALKVADIGIAMGQSGTDVAREAADLVLLDDNFASIVCAVEEGRAVFDNIRKFLTYILSSNIPELVPYLAYVLLRVPLPLTIIQILAVDLGTDMLPALALGAEAPDPDVMRRPPRARGDRLLSWGMLARAYLFLGLLEAAAAMLVYFAVLHAGGWRYGEMPGRLDTLYLQATTACLLTIVVTQVVNVFLCRHARKSLFSFGLTSNRLLLAGIATEIALLVFIVYVPLGHWLFGTAPVGYETWLMALAGALVMAVCEEARKAWRRRVARPAHPPGRA